MCSQLKASACSCTSVDSRSCIFFFDVRRRKKHTIWGTLSFSFSCTWYFRHSRVILSSNGRLIFSMVACEN